MSVSLLIENRFRQLRSSAVHAEDPDAAYAPVVYFRDEVEPYLSLALRIALGKDTTAWFWARAVRNWQPGMTRKEALRILLFSILATAPGSLAILQLMQTLLRAHALEQLLYSLEPEDGTILLQAFDWSASDLAIRGVYTDVQPVSPRASPGMQILANACCTWGGTDDRSLWLAAVLLVLESPAIQYSPALPQHVLSLIRLARDGSAGKKAPASRVLEHPISGPPHEDAEFASAQSSTPVPELRAESVAFEKIIAPAKSADNLTIRAGLFFLLPIMERIGLPRWLEENPQTHGSSFATQILLHFVRRLRTPPGDAIWKVLEEIEEPAPHMLVHFWVSRVRSYCRRVARIGPQSLICRAGRISATSTHLDVQFPASDADIRIRRSGLDIDPGWLPWFGRVVHFQYLARGDFDA